MNIYHFAVCDDRPEDARLVASLAARWARRTGAEVELEVFPSAEAFLFRYQEKKDFDILLLDIEMTGMDGVEPGGTPMGGGDDGKSIFDRAIEEVL